MLVSIDLRKFPKNLVINGAQLLLWEVGSISMEGNSHLRTMDRPIINTVCFLHHYWTLNFVLNSGPSQRTAFD